MLGTGVFCWGWDSAGAAHVQMHVDAAGDLQVDVLTMPAVDGHCWGWDGANWQELIVESAANPNLRTRIYDGANGIDSNLLNAALPGGERALDVAGCVFGYDAANWNAVHAFDRTADARATWWRGLVTHASLYGFNGVTWDRLRTESAANHNLRVRLYDGVNGIDANLMNVGFVLGAEYGLNVHSCLRVFDSVNNRWAPVWRAREIGDNAGGYSHQAVSLIAYDGVNWDRLREGTLGDAYANPTYALEVGAYLMAQEDGQVTWIRVHADANGCLRTLECSSTVETSEILTASTQIHEGDTHIYGIVVNKAHESPVAVEFWEGTLERHTVRWRVLVHGLTPFEKSFYPWMKLDLGLYVHIDGEPDSVILEYGRA